MRSSIGQKDKRLNEPSIDRLNGQAKAKELEMSENMQKQGSQSLRIQNPTTPYEYRLRTAFQHVMSLIDRSNKEPHHACYAVSTGYLRVRFNDLWTLWQERNACMTDDDILEMYCGLAEKAGREFFTDSEKRQFTEVGEEIE